MKPSELFLPIAIVVGPLLWGAAMRLASVASGWSLLDRIGTPLVPDETRRFCTLSLTRGSLFVDFRSFTILRRRGSLIELRCVLTPSWLIPPVCLDAKACTVVDDDRYLTLRHSESGVLLRSMGRSRDVFERARAA